MRFMYLLSISLLLLSCSNNDDIENGGGNETITRKDPIEGSRIAWDYSALQKLSTQGGYNGYARIIEVTNGDFLCVYEVQGSVKMIRSTDKGLTWSSTINIALISNGIAMTVPEITQLSNNDIILSYNHRPIGNNTDVTKKFGIALKISKDNGNTWSEEKIVYQAGHTSQNGCWEPQVLELPSGEVQLYFANEANFTSSHEQDITMLRSFDFGASWSAGEATSFSPTSRDGMPVAIYLDETDEIIYCIEDNFQYNFKPVIIRTQDNWASGTVGRYTQNRLFALNHDQQSPAYQGAPYIRKLTSGNIALSYQGTENRGGNHDIHNSTMYVEIGNDIGEEFKNSTTPFEVPIGRHALWNSLANLDGKIWALATTNAYADATEVWVISGYEMMDNYLVPETIDTNKKYPFFVGHKAVSNVGVHLGYSSSQLNLRAEVNDASVIANDNVAFYIDAKNISSTNPVSNIFKIIINSDGSSEVKEGFDGAWTNSNMVLNSTVNQTPKGYEIDLSINWSDIGEKPVSGERIGFSVSLTDGNPGNGQRSYIENMVFSKSDEPYTWASIKL